MHTESSELAGKTVNVKLVKPFHNRPNETEFPVSVEDYWDKVTGKSWTVSDGNPAAMFYAMRVALSGLPWDDEVVYTHDPRTGLGNLVHLSEILPS